MQLEEYFDFEKLDNMDLIRLKGSRILLETILEEFNQGVPAEQIQKNYPSLSREQVYASITYYLHYQPEIDRYLERSSAQAEAAYHEWERTHTPSPLEARLRNLRAGTTSKWQVAS